MVCQVFSDLTDLTKNFGSRNYIQNSRLFRLIYIIQINTY